MVHNRLLALAPDRPTHKPAHGAHTYMQVLLYTRQIKIKNCFLTMSHNHHKAYFIQKKKTYLPKSYEPIKILREILTFDITTVSTGHCPWDSSLYC